MVAKCANPVCCAPFSYLQLGRVFRIEIRGHSGNESGYGDNCTSRVEHYWLCHVCSTSLTLAVQAGKVVTRPLHHAPRAPGSFAAAAAAPTIRYAEPQQFLFSRMNLWSDKNA